MAKKDLDLSSTGIGDIDSILHNQGVADLSWLAVDETEYRKFEALPKQNLDIIPELQKALQRVDGDDVPSVILLRPHAIVNSNPLATQLDPVRDFSAPIRNRVARLVMAGKTTPEVIESLHLEFAPGDIKAASSAIREVLSERGLIGNVYIDAKHFPLASRDPKEKKLAHLLSKSAKYVVGGCGGSNGCNCHESGFCVTFGGKQVVGEVPYGPNLAAHYAPKLAAEKRSLDFRIASSQNWKIALQKAFQSTPGFKDPDGVKTAIYQAPQSKPQPSAQNIIDFWNRRINSSGVDEMPPISVMKYSRRMIAGADDRSFLVASLEPELRSLASEYGLLGHTWIDMDAVGGCSAVAALIDTKSLRPDFILRRSSVCPKCQCVEGGPCSALAASFNVVTSKPKYDRVVFARALRRASADGRITVQQMQSAIAKASDTSDWQSLTRQANLIKPVVEDHSQYSGAHVSAYYGARGSEIGKVQVDPEEVRRTISHLMNTGMHGKVLHDTVLEKYSRDDLIQMSNVGRRIASEDGVQGHYFVDPTAYKDYGKGCNDGAKHFRKRGAPNVLASSSCTGCTLQTAPGWCSKYAKTLIRSIPASVRQQVANAKRSLPVVNNAPIVDISEQFGLASELHVDLNGAKDRSINIELVPRDVDLIVSIVSHGF